MSSVQDSLPGHVLLGVLEDPGGRHVGVVEVQLLAIGGPHEVLVW